MSHEQTRPRTIRYALQLLPQKTNHPWVPAISQQQMDLYLKSDLFNFDIGTRQAMFILPSRCGYKGKKYTPGQTRMLLIFLDHPVNVAYDHLAGNCDYIVTAGTDEFKIHGDMVCEPSSLRWAAKNRWANYNSEYVLAALIPSSDLARLLRAVRAGENLIFDQGRPPFINRFTTRLFSGHKPTRETLAAFTPNDIFDVSIHWIGNKASNEDALSLASIAELNSLSAVSESIDSSIVSVPSETPSTGSFEWISKDEGNIPVVPEKSTSKSAGPTSSGSSGSSITRSVSRATETLREINDQVEDLGTELSRGVSKLDKVLDLD